jgi:hypothetical protein
MATGNLRCLRVLRIEFSMIREGQQTMGKAQLYPLRFDPIYQYRLWGGRRLASLLSAPLPSDGPDRRSVGAERPHRPSKPGCEWTA